MNASKLVFSNGDPFRVVSVDNQQDKLYIYVQSTSRFGTCPNRCIISSKVHSYYTRKLGDLPVFGKASLIFLRSRKFYCHSDGCPLKVFTERFPSHFQPYQRRTERLTAKIVELGFFAGGKPAERICDILSLATSDTTILRLVEKASVPKKEALTAVGVDDWAFKKRETYGSILVDLHSGKVVDLLPDRESETLRKWLSKRPGIEIMTRDRYSKYRKAITAGAPQAMQVTDRWHLLKNLGEAVQKILTRQYSKANAILASKKQQDPSRQHTGIQCEKEGKENSSGTQPDGIRIKRFKQLKQCIRPMNYVFDS